MLQVRAAVLQLGTQLFEPSAHARQWRAQVVCDIVTDVPDAGHQPLDLVKHGIEITGKMIKVICSTAGRYPL